MQIRIPNELLIPEVIRQLDQGKEVTLRAAGRSMRPYIRDRRDELVLVRADASAIAPGEVVLALDTTGRYVVHRIIKVDGDLITLRGDGNPFGIEHCQRSQVYGLLIAIVRNGHRINCRTPWQRRKAALLRTLIICPTRLRIKLVKTIKRIIK